MANFGLDDLVVVDPYEPVWRETVAAVGGEDVLRKARKLSLPEALADRHLVIGTTTGRRRKLNTPQIPLPELNVFLKSRLSCPGQAAILFGSEKTGLHGEDLERCHAWLNIPTNPQSPSMNLAQAVAVVAYELSRAPAQKTAFKPSHRGPFPAARQIEDLLEKTLDVFEALEYKTHIPRKTLERQLRQALLRWNLTRKDASMLHWLFKKMAERPTYAPARKDSPY